VIPKTIFRTLTGHALIMWTKGSAVGQSMPRQWRRGMPDACLTSVALVFGTLSLLWVWPAEAQVNCTGLSVTQCNMANDQYTLLQNFQGLPTTQAGQSVLKADLATVVSIYNNATPAQRAQAAQNSQSVVSSWNGNVDSYNPAAQYNV